jgi:hypothetical protein
MSDALEMSLKFLEQLTHIETHIWCKSVSLARNSLMRPESAALALK